MWTKWETRPRNLETINIFVCISIILLLLISGCVWERELMLSRSKEEDLDEIEIVYENYFMIHSDDFRHIIREVVHFPNYSGKLHTTLLFFVSYLVE